ncbi:MAG: hypothetical protein VZQ83_05665 [Eubacterium sp.]|nr:hypothetical protein [Eubacterium sp.]
MKKSKKLGSALFSVALMTLALLVFAAPALAAHGITTALTIHIGGEEKKDYLTSLVSVTSKDTSIVTVSSAASGTAASPATRVVYTAVKPGVTTVDLIHRDGKKDINLGPITVTVQDHIWNTEYTVDKEATCTEHGIKSIHCKVDGCDAIKPGSELETPLADHNWSVEYTTDEEPTYFEPGTESRHCIDCGEVNESSIQQIPKLKLGRAKIKSAKNLKTRTAKVTMKMMEGPSGFYFQYSMSKKMKNAKTIYTRNTHVVLKNLRKNRYYYFRAKPVLKEDGRIAKGKWSAIKKLKITK